MTSISAAPALWATLQVLTLNVWGLPDVPFRNLSPQREERLTKLCNELSTVSKQLSGWKVVLLQEVWIEADRERLKNCGYPYSASAEAPSRFVDSGLLILSHYPIEQSTVQKREFSHRGDPLRALEDGEWIARKGVLFAQITHPEAGPIWVANTHLIANYDNGPAEFRDRYAADRESQLEELTRWIKELTGEQPTVLGGDFNFGKKHSTWNKLLSLLRDFSAEAQHSGCTYLGGSPADCQYDHVLASAAFSLISTQVLYSELGLFSDHAGVETRWILPLKRTLFTFGLWDGLTPALPETFI